MRKYVALTLLKLGCVPSSYGIKTPLGLDVHACGYWRMKDGTFAFPLPKDVYLSVRGNEYV